MCTLCTDSRVNTYVYEAILVFTSVLTKMFHLLTAGLTKVQDLTVLSDTITRYGTAINNMTQTNYNFC